MICDNNDVKIFLVMSKKFVLDLDLHNCSYIFIMFYELLYISRILGIYLTHNIPYIFLE